MSRRIKPATNAHPLVRRLIEEIAARGTTAEKVVAEAGVGRNCISNWKIDRNPSVVTLDACFGVLGLQLTVGPRQ